ncbi:ZIP family metal transporter [Brumicola nitratireducens]|uniref:Zinc transporter n=1 Tax=Glaciecola nitratireducens (strain JCM 12485 / KCTC 12276 / FR1064) TaxID=1085623 RepID=G4QDR6_GLANF|nr:ZIP family metal transporter [Glaciecola nitratireducens]AEP31095.1 zinc transporter [Glaciecola nitratireducens FR1064]
MSEILWIIVSGLLMSAIALTGSITLLLKKETLHKVMIPLVAFAAGCLIGGAFFHMIPAGLAYSGISLGFFVWIVLGFCSFFALEQLLHWQHCHRTGSDSKQPLGYMILAADALHNLLGGLAIGGTFLIDIKLGITAWLAAAAHEVPQELGDFAVLIHSGWSNRNALLFNLLSGLTFLAGSLMAYLFAEQIDVTFLLPLAAGNFLYIGASDLVPEVNKQDSDTNNWVYFIAFLVGILLMLLFKILFEL